MNIQIFGAKGFETQKAERYFKERKIKYQYIDLCKYGLSKGEFDSVKAAVGIKDLINVKSKDYERLNMKNLGVGKVAEELLFNNPKLFNSPIVRNGRKATVGYKPEIWAEWE
ncbi:MAG: arsenate reductase family protein [Ruminiclostridium sp.]